MMEEVGRKRERQIDMEKGAERKREFQIETKKEAVGEAQPLGFRGRKNLSAMELTRLDEDSKLKHLVARLNRQNPDAEPIVAEALTEQERAALVQQEKDKRERMWGENLKRVFQLLELEGSQREPSPPKDPNHDEWDLDYAYYRRRWDRKYAEEFGSFEDTTPILAMWFSGNPMPDLTLLRTTLEMFQVKLVGIAEGLRWPLDVFGMMAVRDDLDHNRNVIFNRTRDNCQTLTEKVPYLLLIGPTRAAVYDDHVYFDVVLKVKGSSESEDKDLSLLFQCYRCTHTSCLCTVQYTSKLSTLELTCGMVGSSVEATITVWAGGSYEHLAQLSVHASDADQIVLLDYRYEKVSVATDGMVKLSHRVVCVKSSRMLSLVFGVPSESKTVSFKPLEAGTSHAVVVVGVCELKITVAWSLLPIVYPIDGFPLNKKSGEAGVSTGLCS